MRVALGADAGDGCGIGCIRKTVESRHRRRAVGAGHREERQVPHETDFRFGIETDPSRLVPEAHPPAGVFRRQRGETLRPRGLGRGNGRRKRIRRIAPRAHGDEQFEPTGVEPGLVFQPIGNGLLTSRAAPRHRDRVPPALGKRLLEGDEIVSIRPLRILSEEDVVRTDDVQDGWRILRILHVHAQGDDIAVVRHDRLDGAVEARAADAFAQPALGKIQPPVDGRRGGRGPGEIWPKAQPKLHRRYRRLVTAGSDDAIILLEKTDVLPLHRLDALHHFGMRHFLVLARIRIVDAVAVHNPFEMLRRIGENAVRPVTEEEPVLPALADRTLETEIIRGTARKRQRHGRKADPSHHSKKLSQNSFSVQSASASAENSLPR